MSAFRERYPELADADAQVLGVSMDDLETQKRFAESLGLPFPLLADAAEGYAKRVTFVIGKDGRVQAVFEGAQALDPQGALTACRELAAQH